MQVNSTHFRDHPGSIRAREGFKVPESTKWNGNPIATHPGKNFYKYTAHPDKNQGKKTPLAKI